jgi:haloalkane dehalogenase
MSTEPLAPEIRPVDADTGETRSGAHIPDLPSWLQSLYPFHTRSVPVSGGAMSFAEEGPAGAPPLLLLHGNPGWSFTFRKLIPQLAGRYRVIAPDMVGFGLSDKPADPGYHTLGRHIENLTALVERLGLRNLTLVVHDWGGPVGFGYAGAHPENVARIVATNTWASPLPNPRTVSLPFGVRLANRGALGELLDRALNLSVTSALSAGTETAADMIVEAYKYPASTPAGRLAPRAFWRMLLPGHPAHAELERVHAGLGRITAPVDIVWGAQDRLLSRLPAFLLRDALKNAHEPVFLDDASHYVAEDAPAALLAKLLEQRKTATKLKIIG